jgi:L-2-hydroxycarboxylate dehydrogenase (NAD+)
MKGAILPFDRGYKGSGISMMVEILAGPLIASAYIDNKTFKEEWGTLIIAIDPNILIEVKEFKSHCSDIIRKIKNSRKKNRITEIRLPGEYAKALYNKALKSGTVDIDEVILKQLKYI